MTAKYSDGTTSIVTDDVELVAAPDMSQIGQQTVIVSYQGKEASCTITISPKSAGGEIVTMFKEGFGENTASARVWSDTYKEQTGIASVYANSSYNIVNAKQGKTGSSGKIKSGLIGTSGKDATFEVTGLNAVGYTDMIVKFSWKATSVSKTYYAKLYYSIDGGTSYNEVTETSGNKGATTFVDLEYKLPTDAANSNLTLKVVWQTSNTQGYIDEFELIGVN